MLSSMFLKNGEIPGERGKAHKQRKRSGKRQRQRKKHKQRKKAEKEKKTKRKTQNQHIDSVSVAPNLNGKGNDAGNQ